MPTPLVLSYKNLDFGIKMQYPYNLAKQEDNLQLHTIAAFSLTHRNPFDFANVTLAKVYLRAYNAFQNETSTKLTQGQIIVSYHKNSITTLEGYSALRIASYFFGGVVITLSYEDITNYIELSIPTNVSILIS
ncbi:MAG TPA: hypothetical protein VFI73_13475 [Candidatus Nitrosopolaris sp.]|nr:hypothetical protein [Candidatus Nitrosopolaris sp.]